MDIIDYIVGVAALLFLLLFAIDVFGEGVFESSSAPAAIASCLTCVSGVYFLAGGNSWITGICGFLALAYAIIAIALKGQS